MPLTIIKSQFSRRFRHTVRVSLFASLVFSLQGCAVSWWSDAQTPEPPEEVTRAEASIAAEDTASPTQVNMASASGDTLQDNNAVSPGAPAEILSSPPPAAGHEAPQLAPEDAHKDLSQTNTQTAEALTVVLEEAAPPAQPATVASPVHSASSQQILTVAENTQSQPVNVDTKATKPSEEVIDEETGSLKVVEVKAQPASIERSSTTAALSQNVGSFGIWTLERNWDGEHPDSCRLSTPTRQVEVGDHTSQIWLSLEPGRFVVYASSDIFLKKHGVGLRLDQSKLMSFSQQDYPTRTLVLSDLSEQLEKSKMLHVYLVLGEQKSSLSHQEFSLQDMRKAIPALKRCNG
ncbi:hypothetical protein O5O45_21700 [Hahella aquimaris]|uniref:hypothetical protein n=1 Tax=Hahella sp. HNIBRBA332 TaxID=3015983 RepID=UPI00273BC9A5|nr:hypothetical protein [Hahella sp. HNIBRBA332]WLQ12345.1 hypothetical protein O5O45_21700 [Hahella sp. HNIBRBA332]